MKHLTAYRIKKKYLYFGNNFYLSRDHVALKRYFKVPFYVHMHFKGLWLNGIIEQRRIFSNKFKKMVEVALYDQDAINYLKNFVNITVSYFDASMNEFQYKDQFEINDQFYYIARSKQDNSYIGLLDEVLRKINKGVIRFYKAQDKHKVASIGFDPVKKEWHGWSHRAWSSFKIGHVVKKGSCEASCGSTDEYIKDHPEADISVPVGFIVKNLNDAKRCAIAFADSVS